MSNNGSSLDSVLWSIAIPGFGQLLNKKYIKGIVLILLEFIINVKANINTLIVLSFYGQTELAVEQADYRWLMFYPCVYIYSIWDAYRDSRENVPPLLSIPFAISAYVETIGVIYSKTFRINGVLLGPIFLPMICIFVGLGLGFIIRSLIIKEIQKR
ncbi:MAG: hypothetical protein A2Y23_04210 [Clostridiales bacterium GWB2_37_7]|nr:MAG: hypothetical protein A2Y23_04210 [Clostridiales bacterium GWB2_37_7]